MSARSTASSPWPVSGGRAIVWSMESWSTARTRSTRSQLQFLSATNPSPPTPALLRTRSQRSRPRLGFQSRFHPPTPTLQKPKICQILLSCQLQVRNPFFIESHGECGIQFVRRKSLHLPEQREQFSYNSVSTVEREESEELFDASHGPMMKRIVGGGQAYRGQVPWQVLLASKYERTGRHLGLGLASIREEEIFS